MNAIMSFLIQLTAMFALPSGTLAQCYFPNGGEAGADTACNPNAIVSQYCYDGQACLSNGLCVSDPHNETLARLHRGTCTDKNWKSGNCPRQCLDIDNNGVPVYSCNATGVNSYCCFDNCECTSRWETFDFSGELYTITIIGEDFTQTQSTSSAVSSSTAAPSASITSATSASASESISATNPSTADPVAEKEESSNSTAIGVGVGVGIGAASLIGAATFFFWRRRKNQQHPYGASGAAGNPMELGSNEHHPPSNKYAYYAEASAQEAGSPIPPAGTELPAVSYDPIELPAAPPVNNSTFPRT